jgi:uncharacterized protein YheU (UPF0270 family)
MQDEFSQLLAPEQPEVGVEVPYALLKPETLEQLIKAFVLREGTDYGAVEASLDTKIKQIHRQLEKGDLKIVFDLSTETGSIVPKK